MDNKLAAVHAYVERMRSNGKSDHHIIEGLRKAGWSDDLILRLSGTLKVPLSDGTLVTESPADPATPSIVEPESRVSRGWCPLSLADDGQLRSPSGEFALVHDTEETGTHSDACVHYVVLTRNGQEQWRAEFGRDYPTECAVTDSGYVAVTAETQTEALTGDFFVISPAGQELINVRLCACLNHCGLSNDGSIAWCTTMNNPDDEDCANKLLVFSLDAPGELFRVEDRLGSVRQIWRAGAEVVVSTEEDLYYRYSLKGELLNAQEVDEKEQETMAARAFADGDGYFLVEMAEERLRRTEFAKLSIDEQSLVVRLLERATECQISDSTKARVYRHLGEIALGRGKTAQTISHFRQAITFNPKIGVKKRLEALERELPGDKERRDDV